MRRIMLALCLALSSSAALADNIGMQLDQFNLPVANGKPGETYASADHPGTVYVLESYANFCGYCNENAPNVDAMADYYKGKPVQVVDAGTDTQDSEYRRWIANHHPNHMVLKAKHTFSGPLGIHGIPHVTVLDCNLKVVYENEGVWDDGISDEIKTAVNQAVSSCKSRLTCPDCPDCPDDGGDCPCGPDCPCGTDCPCGPGHDLAAVDPAPLAWECEARPLIGTPIFLGKGATESEARVESVHARVSTGRLGCYVTKCSQVKP